MAQLPPQGGGGFGAAMMATAKLTLRVALNSAANNNNAMNYVASKLYESETAKQNWQTLDANARTIWLQRARTVVAALADTVAF